MGKVTSYPILATGQDFNSEAKVEKINTIVKSQYNSFLEKTMQNKAKPERLKNLVKATSNSVSNVHDYNYGNFNFISMYLSTQAMEPDTIYPVLKIKSGFVPGLGGVYPEISFSGVDKAEAWNIMLNSYGIFVFTYNSIEQEQQISFQTFSKKLIELNVPGSGGKIPAKGWYVNLNFFYRLTGDVTI